MDKWHKTFLWILGFLILGVLLVIIFELDIKAISFAFIFVSLWEILSTATQDRKSKWESFFIRIVILFVFIFLTGIFLNISEEAGGRLFGLVIILELIITISKKKTEHKPNKSSESWWGKQKRYEKVLIILATIIVVPIILSAISNSFDSPQDKFRNDFGSVKLSCTYPEMNIGDKCCVPNTDFGIPVCNEEAIKMNQQLDYAIENNVLTNEQKETIMDKFTLLVPEGYYAIRNSTAGDYAIPLFLMNSDYYGNAIMIRVTYYQSQSGGSIEQFYNDFKKGLDKSVPDAQYSKPVFFENNENKFEIALFNATTKVTGKDTFSSQAIIKSDNEILAISYLSENKESFEYYYYEFDNMVWSVEKI